MERLLKKSRYKKLKLFLPLLVLVLLSIEFSAYAQVRLGQRARQAEQKIDLSYADPKEYEIAEIKIRGLETLNQNAIISLSGLKVGDKIRIPGDAISTAIRKLWKNGIIGDVSIYVTKIEEDKAWLAMDLAERPRLTRIQFEGINKTQQSDLNDKLKLIKGKVLSDPVVKNAELTVRNYFIDKGYLNADVKVIKEKDTLVANGMKITIDVDRKSKVKINDITIIGNQAFTEARLRSKMKKTNEKLRFTAPEELIYSALHLTPRKVVNFFSSTYEVDKEQITNFLSDRINVNFFKTSKFIRSEYKEDKEKLIDWYNSKGYRDALIISDSIYSAGPNEINIDIRIEEGHRYYFRDIIWTGNYVYTDEQLQSVLGINKGDIYDMELVNKRLNFNPQGEDISSLYMDHGYLFYRLDPVEVRIDHDSIDVEMRIYEGEQAKISNVIVTGNDRTNDHVIRREIRTLPGQYFSRTDLIRTQRELSQMGYFDPEAIGIQPIPNPNAGTVDIEYSLVERPSDQIELSGGWGDFFGFVGTVGLVFNNFSVKNIPKFDNWRPLPVGDGQRLQLRVQANGRQFQNYSFTFTEPWLGGKKPNSLTIGYNRSVQDNRFFNNMFGGGMGGGMGMGGAGMFFGGGGALKLTNVSLGIGSRLRWPDDFFTLSTSLGFTLYELEEYELFARTLGFSTGTARTFALTTTLARNSIDQPMFPRSGSQISLSVMLTPPYSLFNNIDYETAPRRVQFEWVEYHKWMFDASFFQKVVGNLVFHARAHMGFLDTYSKRAPVGPFDRFMVGGDGLAGQGMFLLGYDIIGLRGYENNAVTPPNWGFGGGDDRTNGGTIYNKYVFEMRYPVSLNPSATIFLLTFAEAGNNWWSAKEYNPFQLYRASGFGARIFMPAFGLLGIDWGYGFDTLPGRTERSGAQFHFSIGQQIR